MTVFERRMWHWAWSARSRLDLKRAIPGEPLPGQPARRDLAGRGLRWAPSSSSVLPSAPGSSASASTTKGPPSHGNTQKHTEILG